MNKRRENGGEMTVDVADNRRVASIWSELAEMQSLEPSMDWHLECRGTQSGWRRWQDGVGRTDLTPMMAQYQRIKGQLPLGTVLLFRLGDFHEIFFDDAPVIARVINVACTKRGQTPMCGFPMHAADSYINKILLSGRKVAIYDGTNPVQEERNPTDSLTHFLL